MEKLKSPSVFFMEEIIVKEITTVNGREYEVKKFDFEKRNQYYPFNDGWFTFFVNPATGDRKFHLDDGDECIRYDAFKAYDQMVAMEVI